ncbi:hypothetical protein [Parasedimentitalea marina]|uniref:hypothetical protein n=1 Tax=Parasedimentitalea marina TaxID=2483033 RepID=UPI000FDA24E6|nr:hypothetical protein [Parasedimentitalea marina]
MTRRLFKVGDTVDYRHGGKLEVVLVDRGADNDLPYQYCLPGGDTKKRLVLADGFAGSGTIHLTPVSGSYGGHCGFSSLFVVLELSVLTGP